MVPWLFMYLSTSFLLIGSQHTLVPRLSVLLTFLSLDITHSPLLALRPAELPPEFILMGHFPLQYPMMVSQQETGQAYSYCTARICSILTQATLDHSALPSKHKFKLKIINNFKRVTVDHETKFSSLLSTGPCETTQVSALDAGFGWELARNAGSQASPKLTDSICTSVRSSGGLRVCANLVQKTLSLWLHADLMAWLGKWKCFLWSAPSLCLLPFGPTCSSPRMLST